MQKARIGGYGLVLIAAALWATMGLFYKGLMAAELAPITIIFWRAGVAALILFLTLGLQRRGKLHVDKSDWPLFLGFGAIGVATFFVIYIYAIKLTGMGVAAVLMYTAPAWVTVLSTFLFHERLTARKGLALLLAVAGCALVGKVYDLDGITLNLPGLLVGLAAGLTYGFYILFCKAVADRGYNAWTALAYGLGIGALCLLPFQTVGELRTIVTSPELLFWIAILGLVPTLGGGAAFNAGLHSVPASDASIVATLEPAIATFLGWAFMGEHLDPPQILGAGLILAAVVVLQVREVNAETQRSKNTEKN